MKPLVIYHDSCADGFGAAFAAWLKLGDEAEYVACQYGREEKDEFYLLEDGQFDSNFALLNREVYILDFSFPKWIMEGIFSLAKCVVWLDHHKTAFENWCGTYTKGMSFYESLNGKHYIGLDDNRSGAMLAWHNFHPGVETPMFIRHIDDYDRWQFNLPGTKAFNKALWSHTPWAFEQWKEFFWNETHNEDFSIESTGFYEQGTAILRAHEQNVQSVVKGSARPCTMYDLQNEWIGHGLAANCPPHLQSDVGHELANQSGTFGLLWTIDKDMRCKCSLRSNGDYDVSAIAKAFGGGGHKNAAGFEVPVTTLLGWLK